MFEGRSTIRRLPIGLAILVALEGTALWFGALAHTGLHMDMGMLVISEPRIVPAVIVEGITGALLLASSHAIVTRKPWAWTGAMASQVVALGGVLLGITAIALGAGPHTHLNAVLHRVMVIFLVGGIGLGLTTRVRESFATRTRNHGISE